MKIIYRAGDITEAHIIKGLLESNGIDAYVGGYYLQGAVGDLAARDFAHVHVADENQQRATEIISDYEGNSFSKQNNKTPSETTSSNKILVVVIIAILISAIYTLILY
ncbi:MAG: DUF2007 domain-containing protein [Candidatus Thiodiazotropha sp.]|jgi:hypothetical protein